MVRIQLGRMPRARKLMEGLGALFKDYRIVIVPRRGQQGGAKRLESDVRQCAAIVKRA